VKYEISQERKQKSKKKKKKKHLLIELMSNGSTRISGKWEVGKRLQKTKIWRQPINFPPFLQNFLFFSQFCLKKLFDFNHKKV